MTTSLFSVFQESNKATLIEVVQDSSNRCALNSYYLLSRKIKELKAMIRNEKNKKTKVIWSYHLCILEAVELRLAELELNQMREALRNGG